MILCGKALDHGLDSSSAPVWLAPRSATRSRSHLSNAWLS